MTRLLLSLLSLVLLQGGTCTEYGVDPFDLIPDDGDDSGDSSLPVDSQPTPDTEPPPMCAERVWSAGQVGVDEGCSFTAEVGGFEPVVEWTYSAFDDFADWTVVHATPVVGQLTDDDGDGDVDSNDIPDVAVLMEENAGDHGLSAQHHLDGVLRLLSGDGSGVHWSVYEQEWGGVTWTPFALTTPTLGDIDLDGEPEIVVTMADTDSCHAGAFDRHGVLEWVNTETTVPCDWSAPSLADLDGDGSIEVVIGADIYNGEDGSLHGEGAYNCLGEASHSELGPLSFGVDLDNDGSLELLAGCAIYESDAEVRCYTGYADGYPAAADIDGDGDGEMVVTGNGMVRIFDEDCRLMVEWELMDAGYGGPATIADFDGDTEPEIGMASENFYYVFETDGTLLWFEVTDDGSDVTGSSVYDFEGDGYAEVVYADEETLWVFQGATGEVRLEDGSHDSWTANEYPVIVDVDGDGEVEIVVANYDGLVAIGDADRSWVPARQVWNQHAYHISNVNDDLSIPSPTLPNWPEHNTFRSGDITPNLGATAPDLVPVLVDVCTDECDQDVLQIVVQLGNQGLAAVEAGVPLAVYALEGDQRRLVHVEPSVTPIASGRTNPGMEIELSAAAFPEGRLVLVADDDGTGAGLITECSEDNNELMVEEGLCP
jgi:hypothetical protein